MTELIGTLVSQLGVKEEQASGGAGLLFKLAQENLGGDFSQVTKAFPGVLDLISKAPTSESGGGLMGMAGAALNAFGGESAGGLADLAKMTGALDSIGLDMATVMKFAPIVLDFVKSQDADVATLLERALS